ncbi:hypothetical protein MMC12_004436 [Toensbergia leucococca]|nr:hypothetical protein [Toensbergia leucococca]
MGRGTGQHQESEEHLSRPLATLKDPSAFGPPPKHISHHGGAALPNTITPDRRGLGVPLTPDEIRVKEQEEMEQRAAEEAEEAERNVAHPPVPYRADTTGLSTNNLPKPPLRRLEYEGQAGTLPTSPVNKQKPSLPPRLPPRQNSNPHQDTPPPPPPYTEAPRDRSPQKSYLNQGALNRLGSAGISVPGLGISKGPDASNPWQDQAGSVGGSTSASASNSRGPQLNELQSRFSRLSSTSPKVESHSQGTSFAQKQAALKTASSFRNDPSSVSLADAKRAASTANNFRERHGDQVASGWKSANSLNKKYDIANKVNGYATNGSNSPVNEAPPTPPSSTAPSSSSLPVKKKPPPPPPKKVFAESGAAPSPPPVPLASRPKFG